ncbi:PAS domain S-box protein, partial [Chloroflexota bacterium]
AIARLTSQEALRDSEERYRRLADNATDIIWTMDMDMRLTYVSPSVSLVRGYSVEEVMEQTLDQIITPESVKLAMDTFSQELETLRQTGIADPVELEFEQYCKDGSTIWSQAQMTFLQDSDGEPVGILGVTRDISDRKKAEEALRDSEKKYRLLVDNISDFIALTDLDAVITYIGPAHRKFGFEPEDLVGKAGLPYAHPEDLQNIADKIGRFYDRDLIARLVKTGGTVPEAKADYRVFDAWGNERYLESVTNLIVDPNGENHQVLHISRDITERKLVEEKEREAESLKELDRLRSELLSNVSHELRTPLTTIKGYTTMLMDYDDRLEREEKIQYLHTINTSSDRMNELVSNLLEMSRLDAGMLKLDKQPSDVSLLVQQAATEAKVRAHGHVIVTKVQKKLPTVYIDAGRIRQVLDNMLDNAVKYSGLGTTVTVRATHDDSNLIIKISDQGIGVPVDDLENVFDRMYRVEHGLVMRAGGAGLGLSISKGIVEAHGGRIWIESEEGKGSTCIFTLPLQ